MKKERLTRKRLIQKRIEYRHQNLGFINRKEDKKPIFQDRPLTYINVAKNEIKPEEKKIEAVQLILNFLDENGNEITNEADILKIYGIKNKLGASTVDVKSLIGGNINFGPYQKKAFVDYDIVICIPSYERYKKVKRLISQFYEQSAHYTFKIVLLNDGSTNLWYDRLINYFPDIIYLKNDKPNGKLLHWYCYLQMWECLKDIQCHAVLQMDDDFILCDNFLNTIVDLYFEKKEVDNNMMAIAPHTWSFNKIDTNIKFDKYTIDGIGLFDVKFIETLKRELKPVSSNVVHIGVSVGVWSQFINILRQYEYYAYRTEFSLAWHDGNEDSKLHASFRNKRRIYTQNFIDNRRYD